MPKESIGVKHNKIVDILIAESLKAHTLHEGLGLFPYVVYRPKGGLRQLCEIVGYKHISFSNVENAAATIIQRYQEYALTSREAVEIVKLFVLKSPELSHVRMVDFRDGDNWTFQRLDFDSAPFFGCPPTFDSFLNNSSNRHALAAFIGSLMFADSDKQQYLWMYGQGKNGKSSLMRFMSKLLGPVACTAQPEYIMKNNFGTSMLLGKRLCMFPDTNNYGFVKSGLFKSLTGGDQVKIERKREQAFNIELDTKFMISSNDQPMITSQECDMRRIIFCEFGTPKSFDPTFELQLWNEREGILAYCMAEYDEYVTENGQIKSDQTEAENIAKAGQYDYWEQIFDECFIIDQKSKNKDWCTSAELERVLNFQNVKSYNDQQAFKKHLRTVYNLVSEPFLKRGKVRRGFKKLRVKDPKMTRPLTPRNEKVVTRMFEHEQDVSSDDAKNNVREGNFPNFN